MALRVKCKGCGVDVPATANDPPRPSPGGGQAFAATCPACGAVTHYRRPEAPAPAANPLADLDTGAVTRESREMRLPAIVLKAAWWVRLTLMIFWTIVILYVSALLVGAAFTVYFESRNPRSSR